MSPDCFFSLVTQYDVEAFVKCEEFIKKKLDLFPLEEEDVLIFMDRVSEANRLAATVPKTHPTPPVLTDFQELRETGFGQKKRKLTSQDLTQDAEGGPSPTKKQKKYEGKDKKGPTKKGRK